MRSAAPVRAIGGVLLFLALWEVIIDSHIVHFEYLPPPTAIFVGLGGLLTQPDVYGDTWHTLSVTLVGWLIAAGIGLILGCALGLSSLLRTYSLTTIEVLRPIPPVALIPIGLLLFGFSSRTELFVVVLPSIWPVLVNTMIGIQSTPTRLRDVSRVLRLGPVKRTLSIFLPAASPAIFVGLRLSMGISLVLAVISEMIGNPQGLGYAVVSESQALRPDLMFAYIIMIGFLGIVLNGCIVQAARWLQPGAFSRPAAAKAQP